MTPSEASQPTKARSSPDVAIVGAGWSGMAAAVELATRAVPVTVFEAARTLGGRARRVDVNGLALDNGLHILIGAYREALRLIAKVSGGREPALHRQRLDLHVVGKFRLRAAPLPAPLHLAGALLCARGLSFTDRQRAAQWLSRLRATGFRLREDVSVATLLSRENQTHRVRKYLWEPLCTSALNTPVERASGQVFLNVLRDSLNGRRRDSDLLLPTTDLSALFPEPAARYVEQHGGRVLTGTPVSALRVDDGGLLLETAAGAKRFSHVICALPPHRVSELFATLPSLRDVSRAASEMVYEPIYSVYIQYPQTSKVPQEMFGLDAAYSQWVFDRGRLTGQRGLLGVVISASGRHQGLEHEALATSVDAELRAHVPNLGNAQWNQVIAEKRATFSCAVGVERPPQRTPVPNLYLAGDYTASDYPATLEAAVRSGIASARMILESV